MTAETSAADTDSSKNFCFISYTNLAKFNSCLKNRCKILYQLAKINSAVCCKVKQHFIVIKSILCVNQLHLKSMLANLLLADLESVEKKKTKVAKLAQAGIKEAKAELPVLNKVFDTLQEGIPARTLDLSEDDLAVIRELNLITLKPVLYVLNISEDDIADPMKNEYVKKASEEAEKEGAKWIPISAEIEEEVSELDPEEAKMFLADLGEDEPGVNHLIRAAYSMLGLINFFTVGPDECRAWTVRAGTKAPKAAGKIHSDIERGFIRAEIVSYNDLMRYGSYANVREKGLLRVEGKDYIIQDGDVAYFRFNV